jgi:hypothetical protein
MDKDKQRAEAPTFDRDAAKRTAIRFEARGTLVRRFFARWLERVMDRAENRASYEKALHRSEAYAKRVRDTVPRKRPSRPSSSFECDSPRRRERKRPRPSAEYKPPQTDDALAARLKEVGHYSDVCTAPRTRLSPYSEP